MAVENDSLKMIELHERTWGEESYPGRPGLADMMKAPVLVFWRQSLRPGRRPDDRYKASIHEGLEDVEAYLTKTLFRLTVKQPERVIARIYINGRRVRVSGITIHFEETGDKA